MMTAQEFIEEMVRLNDDKDGCYHNCPIREECGERAEFMCAVIADAARAMGVEGVEKEGEE